MLPSYNVRCFEIVDEKFINKDFECILPQRATIKSAGYDFYNNAGKDVVIPPGDSYTWITNVKAFMNPNEFLYMVVRSSIGIKKKLMLCNTNGIIDADFYNNENNNGCISICLFNYGKEGAIIKKDERIVQGIFMNYLTAINCNSDNQRVGGIGSSN